MPRAAPGPSKLELLGSFGQIRARPLEGLETLHAKHGDIVRVSLRRDYFLVSDPAAIRHVLRDNRKNYDKTGSFDDLRLLVGDGLLTAGNEGWAAQRKALSKAFLSGEVNRDVDRVCATAAELGDEWSAAGDGARLVSADFARLTLRLSSSMLLGADASSDAAQVGAALDRAQTALIDRMKSVTKLPLGVPTPGNRELRRSVGALDAVLAGLLARPDAEPRFLQRLATLEEPGRVRDEAMTFLLAGYDTTSHALSWTVHLLSRHPDEQARLQAELAEVCGDAPPDAAALARLPHLDRAIAESLRLFPPVPIMLRDVLADDELGGYPVAKGSVVAVIPYLAHRHPAHWSEPAAFRPDRFRDAGDLPAYLPFGVLPRGCIGEQMAQLWMKATLATLLQRFSFREDPTFTVEAEPMITLLPKHGMRVLVGRAPGTARDRARLAV